MNRSGTFYLFCLPALVSPSGLSVDILKEKNTCPLGQVRCLFFRCYYDFCVCSAFHHLHCLRSAVCIFFLTYSDVIATLPPVFSTLSLPQVTNAVAWITVPLMYFSNSLLYQYFCFVLFFFRKFCLYFVVLCTRNKGRLFTICVFLRITQFTYLLNLIQRFMDVIGRRKSESS